ncbi:MAG: sporulation protein YunB [Erysipelotrichia bacterium]|nr:sporulation protein YunB [Erysipelotrichia bacterium]NCC54524.1 sporulation protein YunB [Erysipelotrichia bacterium]
MLKPQLMALAVQKSNDAISMLAQKVLGQLNYDASELIIYRYNDQHEVIGVEYDTKKLNDILYGALDIVDNSLEAAENGEVDPLLKEVLFDDGVIYEIPIGYLSGIAFLENYGYRFKVTIRMLHYTDGDLEVKSEPYGINNSLITINLNLNIHAKAITAIAKQDISFTETIPLVVQVIQGDIPAYTTTIGNANKNE